jgi:uncharacterized membrane protein
MIDLSTLGGTASYALAVNSHGQVVGYSTTAGAAVLCRKRRQLERDG